MTGFVQRHRVNVGVARNFPFRHDAGVAVDDTDGFLVRQVNENPRAFRFQLKRFRVASDLEFLQALHRGGINDRQRGARTGAVAHIEALCDRIVAHVVGVGIGAEIQLLTRA